MITKKGKYPANARVDIIYEDGKPKVKFDYPPGRTPTEQARKQCRLGYGRIFIFYFFIGIFIYALFFYPITDEPRGCNFISHNESESIVTIYCDNGEYELMTAGTSIIDSGSFTDFGKNRYPIFLTFLSLLFFASFTILCILINGIYTNWLIRNKKFVENNPVKMAGGKRRRKKYKKFLPEDVEDNVLLIPYFKNVELDYKTEGDFSKYLKRIKIRESRYNRWRNGKIGKEKINYYDWSALFVFTQKPKSGYLEVVYQ